MLVIGTAPSLGSARAAGDTAAVQVPNQVPIRPDIVMFLLDDLSWLVFDTAVAARLPDGSPVLPNIRRYIYDKAVDFRQAFASNPICCPSRATIYSGQYSHNHRTLGNTQRSGSVMQFKDGHDDDGNGSPDGDTVAYALQRGGYRTVHIGKYLNGYGGALKFRKGADRDEALATFTTVFEDAQVARLMVDLPETGQTYRPPGWTEWYASLDPTTYCAYNTVFSVKGEPVLYHSSGEVLDADNLPPVLPLPGSQNYQTDVIATLALEFLDDNADVGVPLFMSIATLVPHVEICDWSYARLGEVGPVPSGTAFPFWPNAMSEALDYRGLFLATVRPAPRDATAALNAHFEAIAHAVLTQHPSFNEPDYGGMSDKPWFIQRQTPPLTDPYRDVYPYQFDPQLVATPPEAFDWDVQNETAGNMAIKQLARMIASLMAVDRMVGAVAEKLDAHNRLANTVFVLTSDNGYAHGQHRLSSKLLAYEDSARVPLFVSLPSLAERQVSFALVLNNDLTPTFLDLAEADDMTIAVDGTSFKPLLESPTMGWRRQALLEQFLVIWPGEPGFNMVHPTSFAVRTSVHHPSRPRRKYVEYFGGMQYGPSRRWEAGFYLCPAEDPDCSPVRSWAYEAGGASLIPSGDLGQPGGREYFNLALDPFEQHNGYWRGAPAGIRNAGASDCAYLKAHLNALTACSGAGCRTAEWTADVAAAAIGECPQR